MVNLGGNRVKRAQGFLDAEAAADMLARENSGPSVPHRDPRHGGRHVSCRTLLATSPFLPGVPVLRLHAFYAYSRWLFPLAAGPKGSRVWEWELR